MDKELFLLLIGAGIALLSSVITATIQHFLSLRAERTKLKMEREIDLEMKEKERERQKEEERRKMILEGVQQFALKTALGQYDQDTAHRVANMVTHSTNVQLETNKSFSSFMKTAFESGNANQVIQSTAREILEQVVTGLEKQGDL